MPKRKAQVPFFDHPESHGKIFKFQLKGVPDLSMIIKSDKPITTPKQPETVYKGRNPGDAGMLIDLSQGEFGLNSSIPGHPRAHVSRGSKGVEAREMYCVENFSLASDERKTGFFLRSDQDKFVHKALTSPQGQEKLRCLNVPGKFEVQLCASMGDFEFCAGLWEKGDLKETFKPEKGVVVLQHKRKYPNPCKPPPATQSVHIFTAYPIRPKKTDKKKSSGGSGGGTGKQPERPGCPPGCDEGSRNWYFCKCSRKELGTRESRDGRQGKTARK